MRRFAASLIVIASVSAQVTALQPGRGAAGAARPGACALLTKELVTQVSPYEKKALGLVLQIPAEEEPVGPSGAACSYGGIYLQVDPFAPGRFEQLRDKTWVPVPGIGDTAYFRDNKGMWAELYARAGARAFTIQMDVPSGATVTSIMPNVLALAKALLPRLK